MFPRKLKLVPSENCCKQRSIALIKSHGEMDGTQFRLFQKDNLIILTRLGNLINLDSIIYSNIKAFYNCGHHIFNNNDKSLQKTVEGIYLETYLRTLDPSIQIKNHIDNSMVNNMMLDFVSYPCSIDCIVRNREVDRRLEISNCLIKNNKKLGRIGLNKLVDIEYDTHNFIVIICKDH